MSCKLGGADRGLVGTSWQMTLNFYPPKKNSWQMKPKVFHQTISIFAPTAANIFTTTTAANLFTTSTCKHISTAYKMKLKL